MAEMTPQRKAYLEKCNWKERYIRAKIAQEKGHIKHNKQILNSANLDEAYDCFSFEIDYLYHEIKYRKYKITVLRHELQRLKGMDRVVVPIDTMYDKTEGFCTCGNDVNDFETYCSDCGRKLLWEKAK